MLCCDSDWLHPEVEVIVVPANFSVLPSDCGKPIALGVEAEGPIQKFGELIPALKKALAVIAGGRPYLLDVLVERD